MSEGQAEMAAVFETSKGFGINGRKEPAAPRCLFLVIFSMLEVSKYCLVIIFAFVGFLFGLAPGKIAAFFRDVDSLPCVVFAFTLDGPRLQYNTAQPVFLLRFFVHDLGHRGKICLPRLFIAYDE